MTSLSTIYRNIMTSRDIQVDYDEDPFELEDLDGEEFLEWESLDHLD